MIENWDVGVAGKYEVAMHAVNGVVEGYGCLSRGETLRYSCSAIDAACTRGMPHRASIGVHVWLNGVEGSEFEDIFDGGFGGVDRSWFDQRCVFGHGREQNVRSERRERVQSTA